MRPAYYHAIKAPFGFSLKAWGIVTIAAFFYCYEYLLRIMPSTMTDELMAFFSINSGELGFLIATYMWAYAPMQLLVGVLMDRFGPRLLLTVACFCCVLGTILFSYTNSFWITAAGRFMVGFGSAFAFVGVLKLATEWLPPERFALVSGITTALGMVGAMVGNKFLSTMVANQGWQDTTNYFIYLGVGLTFVILFAVKNSPVQKNSENGAKPIEFSTLFRGLGQVLCNRQVLLNGVIGGLMFMSLSVFADTWGNHYLMHSGHYDLIDPSKGIQLIFLGWAIGSPICGLVSDSIGLRRSPIILGSLLTALVVSALLYLPGSFNGQTLYALLFLYGVFSSVQVLVFAIGRENAPSYLGGTAIAVTNMLVMLFGAIFQPIFGYILHHVGEGGIINGVPHYSPESYLLASAVLPIGAVLSFFIGIFMLRETHARTPN